MSKRHVLLIAVLVAGVAIAVYVLAFALFNTGGTVPGEGRGESTTVETTP